MNTIQGKYFDTVNSITAECPTALLEAAMKLCEKYERILSKTISGSDVWKINHSRGDRVQIKPETRDILVCALDFYDKTAGAFNIGMKPLIDLWDVKHRHTLPTEDEIKAALHEIDISEIRIENDSVIIPDKRIGIDLGGVAKGYIADCIANFLRSNGVDSALLNFGGNIVCVGNKPDGTPWNIGLQSPFGQTQTDFFAITEITDGTVVTSGIYERCFMCEGRIYHHIIDPRTGQPSASGIISASVIGKDSMIADTLATSIILLGWEKGLKLAEEYGYYAVCISENGSIYKSKKVQIKAAV